jgi:hypothetical protein
VANELSGSGFSASPRPRWVTEKGSECGSYVTVDILRRARIDVLFLDGYDATVKRFKPWLSSSDSSAVPEDFDPIEIVKHEPVCCRREIQPVSARPEIMVKLQTRSTSAIALPVDMATCRGRGCHKSASRVGHHRILATVSSSATSSSNRNATKLGVPTGCRRSMRFWAAHS